jgi:hypothetical protein
MRWSGRCIAKLNASNKQGLPQRCPPPPPYWCVLQFYLSSAVLGELSRCFSSGHHKPVSDGLNEILQKCLVSDTVSTNDFKFDGDAKEYLQTLQKTGILVQDEDRGIRFSSPLARRFYWQVFFAKREKDNPPDLDSLVMKVLKNLSRSSLQKSITREKGFPNEATFQHLFMEGLALFTKPTCSIIPELAETFPSEESSSSSRIPGKIDFYLNSNLMWRIELLVGGRGIGEHISRFQKGGKYSRLECSDWVVIDIRLETATRNSNVEAHPNRITVFFQDGYKTCKCRFRKSTMDVELQLKP